MEQRVEIETVEGGARRLDGTLNLPTRARGCVVFAHGSGSSRLSPRNRHVATALSDAGFATLLFDLLTEDEALDRANVFDIPLLAGRVCAALDWCAGREGLAELPVGLFGASTGAAAALAAAARMPSTVGAVVSRGGRPDLAEDSLPLVRAPTLLIVGGADTEVIALNRAAFARLDCPKALEIVPNASHLFEEPGTLDAVVAFARGWFMTHLGASRTQSV